MDPLRWLQAVNETMEDHHDDELHQEGHNDKPWGDVILASFLIQLVTLSGLVLTVGLAYYSRRKRQEESKRFYQMLHTMIIPSFAAGALLGTAAFLLIPEAMNLLSGGHDEEEHGEPVERRQRWLQEEGGDEHAEEESLEENEVAWRFATALLGGFLLPLILGALFPPPHDAEQICEECRRRELADAAAQSQAVERYNSGGEDSTGRPDKTLDEGCDSGECQHEHHHHEAADAAAAAPFDKSKNVDTAQSLSNTPDTADEAASEPARKNYTLAASLTLGDVFHNFTDGIFIGNAFLLCDRSVAYTIVATTVYHELAQEIADFCLLTHHCGLSVQMALLYNFCAGFSVLVGALLILAVDLSETGTAVLLALSAGVYLHIACTECVPRVQQHLAKPKDTLVFVLCFITGCVPIGLVLLNHGHCEAH